MPEGSTFNPAQHAPQATAFSAQPVTLSLQHGIAMRSAFKGLADCTKTAGVSIVASLGTLIRPAAGTVNAAAMTSKESKQAAITYVM